MNTGRASPTGPAIGTALDTLLQRLQSVRQHGEAWRADCPCGHGHAKGSLRIAIGDDGRVLLHCFAGCEAADVANGVGLHLADLFPKPVTRMSMKNVAEPAIEREKPTGLQLLACSDRRRPFAKLH